MAGYCEQGKEPSVSGTTELVGCLVTEYHTICDITGTHGCKYDLTEAFE